MEKLLIKEQEKFTAVFQNASLGILLINDKGDIELANDFALRMFGYERSEVLGKKLELLLPQRFHSTHVKERKKFNAHPATRPMGRGRELFGLKKEGQEIPLEISLSSFTNEDGVFSIAFISDISLRRETEKKLLQQRLALAEMNKKMEAQNDELEKKVHERTLKLQEALRKLELSKDELYHALNKEKDLNELKSAFVSMASHEFRTPLSTILSSASLLSKYKLTEEQPNRDKHVQRIKSAVTNLNNILNEFLSLGKIEEGKIKANFTSFNIHEMIIQQVNEMNDILKHGQQIHYTHTGSEMVELDDVLFKNILINLISNAAKFSPEEKTITILSVVSGKKIIFSISDEGMGISKQDQRHIFELFFRAKNAANIPGTGLGLHIVAKYVEMMNGHLKLKSNLETGTEIKIEFNQ
ncbi:MAG: PAS domain-containing sensor histidine kinase [Bacteroidetes bacterium]|nr:PAS domain-containing sensor histidine kinase [Bacteroidota bacterium]